MEGFIQLFTTAQMQIIIFLVIIDVILGILAAIVKNDFVFAKLADFMKWPFWGYIVGFALVQEIGANLFSFGEKLILIAFILIGITIITSIFRNLGKLFGATLPAQLRK